MQCSCVIDYDYDSIPDFYTDKKRIARKEHKCTECKSVILKGEDYQHLSGKFEGDFFNYKHCLNCISLSDVFNSTHRCDIREHISECDYEIPEDCMSELTPKAREWVCFVIEEGWEFMDQKKGRYI